MQELSEPNRGVFWVVDGELLAFPFHGDACVGVAKSGNTFNHKKLWEALSVSGKPYNYYPRGRMDINNRGRISIYLNPNINTEDVIAKVKGAFGIQGQSFRVCPDYSEHYQCHLDEDWKDEGSR